MSEQPEELKRRYLELDAELALARTAAQREVLLAKQDEIEYHLGRLRFYPEEAESPAVEPS